MRRPRIAVVGSANMDLIVCAERIPKPGETVLGSTFRTALGGKGANQAVAAARLGAAVTFVARVGNDEFGNQALNQYEREGLVTDYVTQDPSAPTGVALIVVDEQGENAIAVAPGANGNLSEEHIESSKEAIQQADVLLLQLEIPMRVVHYAARVALAAGVRIILNPAPAQPIDKDLLRSVTVLTPNENEVATLADVEISDDASTREAARCLRSGGVPSIVVTQGARGAYVDSGELGASIPGLPVTAVDTTAAGDAMNGALAWALASGQSLLDAVEFSMKAAAFCVTRPGAHPSLPTSRELNAFIEDFDTRRA